MTKLYFILGWIGSGIGALFLFHFYNYWLLTYRAYKTGIHADADDFFMEMFSDAFEYDFLVFILIFFVYLLLWPLVIFCVFFYWTFSVIGDVTEKSWFGILTLLNPFSSSAAAKRINDRTRDRNKVNE